MFNQMGGKNFFTPQNCIIKRKMHQFVSILSPDITSYVKNVHKPQSKTCGSNISTQYVKTTSLCLFLYHVQV